MGIGNDSYNHETYGVKTISIFQKVFPNHLHPNSNLPQNPKIFKIIHHSFVKKFFVWLKKWGVKDTLHR